MGVINSESIISLLGLCGFRGSWLRRRGPGIASPVWWCFSITFRWLLSPLGSFFKWRFLLIGRLKNSLFRGSQFLHHFELLHFLSELSLFFLLFSLQFFLSLFLSVIKVGSIWFLQRRTLLFLLPPFQNKSVDLLDNHVFEVSHWQHTQIWANVFKVLDPNHESGLCDSCLIIFRV